MTNPLVLFKNAINYFKQLNTKDGYTPAYRVLEIIQNEKGEYVVNIQIIHKRATFHIKPEEILSDDNLVALFSPYDIRTLTYLGYLGINSPKYKILAQRLVDEDKIVFAISQKGIKNVVIKTAAEIMRDRDIISNMTPLDASTIGYTVASEKPKKS